MAGIVALLLLFAVSEVFLWDQKMINDLFLLIRFFYSAFVFAKRQGRWLSIGGAPSSLPDLGGMVEGKEIFILYVRKCNCNFLMQQKLLVDYGK
jgi:hypothetical protein